MSWFALNCLHVWLLFNLVMNGILFHFQKCPIAQYIVWFSWFLYLLNLSGGWDFVIPFYIVLIFQAEVTQNFPIWIPILLNWTIFLSHESLLKKKKVFLNEWLERKWHKVGNSHQSYCNSFQFFTERNEISWAVNLVM